MNNHCKLLLSLALCLIMTAQPLDSGFVLITSLYNETHQDRAQEYLTCLKKNLLNKFISEIHVLYDTAKDTAKDNLIYDFLLQNNITITHIHGRPTYEFCFSIANTYPRGTRILLANADIYFNDTLTHLVDFDFKNVFIALTRWDVQKNGSISMRYTDKGKQNQCSQDTWIFTTPLLQFKSDFCIGTQHCDGKIAFQAHKAGLKVMNPCFTIQSCHLQLSNIRNYALQPFSKKITKPVPWCHLPKNKKKML